MHINFQLLFESVPGAYLVLAPSLQIVAVSNAYLKATMTDRESIVGKNLFEVFPDNSDSNATGIKNLRASLEKVLTTKSPDRMQSQKYNIKRPEKSGGGFEVRYGLPSNIPVINSNNEIEYIIHEVQDVTEIVHLRNQEEEVSRQNEYRLQSIIDNSMDGILLVRQHSEIVSTNKAATKISGYTEPELCSLGYKFLVDRVDPGEDSTVRRLSQTNPFRGEFTFNRKNDLKIPIEISLSTIEDAKGEKWTSIFIRDITERKNADKVREELLRRLDEKKRWIEAVIENAPVAILLFKGSKGEIVIPNNCAKKIFGGVDWSKGKEALIGIILEPDTREPLESYQLATSRALQGETVSATEKLICREDGVLVSVIVNSGPIKDRLGNVLGAVTIFQDLSQWKKAQEQLKIAAEQIEREKRWLKAVFENSPIGIFMFYAGSSEDPIPNHHARKMFGIKLNEVTGSDSLLGNAYDANGKVLSMEELFSNRILNGETMISEEQVFRFPDGSEYPLLISGAPIYDESDIQMGAVTFFQDITSIKELEQLREEWAAIIAHDLRQPITTIKLAGSVLKDAPDLDKKYKEFAQMIELSAKQLNRMTNDLLDISKIEANQLKLEIKVVDIEKFMKQIVKKINPLFPNNPIKLFISNVVSDIEIDPDRFDQVIGNLISNASKYGFPDTEIIIRVFTEKDFLKISIVNKGMGIEPGDINKIFKRFHRTSTARKEGIKGTGLGLYIAKSLIEAHGGRIYVESTPGETTTFRIEIPLKNASFKQTNFMQGPSN